MHSSPYHEITTLILFKKTAGRKDLRHGSPPPWYTQRDYCARPEKSSKIGGMSAAIRLAVPLGAETPLARVASQASGLKLRPPKRASGTNWVAVSYYFPMSNASKVIASCCLTVLVALYVVGAVSHGSLRHEVQTLPLWFPIVLGFRRREVAKWSALPCLIFWLHIVVLIWLFLLGWARLVTGHFSAIEIAMTLIIGIACIIGLALSFRWRTSLSWLGASTIAVVFAILQLAAFRISLIPYIATR